MRMHAMVHACICMHIACIRMHIMHMHMHMHMHMPMCMHPSPSPCSSPHQDDRAIRLQQGGAQSENAAEYWRELSTSPFCLAPPGHARWSLRNSNPTSSPILALTPTLSITLTLTLTLTLALALALTLTLTLTLTLSLTLTLTLTLNPNPDRNPGPRPNQVAPPERGDTGRLRARAL